MDAQPEHDDDAVHRQDKDADEDASERRKGGANGDEAILDPAFQPTHRPEHPNGEGSGKLFDSRGNRGEKFSGGKVPFSNVLVKG